MSEPESLPAAELLAIVEVDKADRVVCQADGCGHSVYRRIHVVRHDGRLGVYGSDCFARLFEGLLPEAVPRYGGSAGRELTPLERLLLLENTERLISQFEAEEQARVAQTRAWQEHQQQLQQEQLALLEQQRRAEAEQAAAREAARHETERRRPPTDAEIASVERQAKAIVKATYGVDPDAPGWRGLVLKHARELLGK